MAKLKAKLATIWSRTFGNIKNPDVLKVPILCYHSVNSEWNDDADPLTPERFEEHLRYLSDFCDVITLEQFLRALKGEVEVSDNSVVVTFDDGYIDNYEIAYPLVKKYRIPICIFVVTGLVDGRLQLIPDERWRGFNWEQALEMEQSGLVTIAPHTDSHPILSTLEDVQAIEEVKKSKDLVESHLQKEIGFFAYPNGQGADIPSAVLNAMPEMGFEAACSTFWRTSHQPDSRYLLNRVMISSSDSVETLKAKIRGDYDFIFYIHKFKALGARV